MSDSAPNSKNHGPRGLRALAVVFAVTVMALYVWDAQRRADDRAAERAAEPVDAEGAEFVGPPSRLAEQPAPTASPEFLPSSKFAAIVDENGQPLPSTKGIVIPPNLFGSKSGVSAAELDGTLPAVLPSSKVMVIDEQQFLFSSKSAAPMPPTTAPAEEPTAGGAAPDTTEPRARRR